MGQSLKARFNGDSEKVVQYARQFGVGPAMDEYKVKTYDRMLEFLEDASHGEKFQYAKVEVGSYAGPDAFDKLLESMLRKYGEMESKITNLVAENMELKRQVEYYKVMKWSKTRPIVQGVLQYCEGEK